MHYMFLKLCFFHSVKHPAKHKCYTDFVLLKGYLKIPGSLFLPTLDGVQCCL